MSSVVLNDRITSEETLGSLLSNRGFLYGDGFFETIALRDGRVFFLEEHLERALTAMQVLQLSPDQPWDITRLKSSLQQLWIDNGSPKDAVFKWIMWRNSEGLYSPTQEKSSHYLIEIKNYRSAPVEKKQAYIASTVTNAHSIYSSFKRLSALHYVMAGLEKKSRQADELILADQYGNLSEATSSGLFWIINNTIYTPALDTGCVEGVVRKAILKWAIASGVKTQETKSNTSGLTHEATVFTANIAGFSLINQLENTPFKNDHVLYTQLQQDLFNTTSYSQNL